MSTRENNCYFKSQLRALSEVSKLLQAFNTLVLFLTLNLLSSYVANAETETEPAQPLKIEKLGPICGKLEQSSTASSSALNATSRKASNPISTKFHFSGVADYYAEQFHGKKTASGQIHDKGKYTAAHRTLPFGTKLKVVSRHTGKACLVTVNDRGPFTKSRIIDLSVAAAKELGLITAKSRLVDCYIVED